MSLCLASKECYAASAEVAVSVVKDSSPGPAAKHGIHKIMEVLQAKWIAAEQVTTLEAAKGKSLIVTGLTSGSGAAANLLQTLNIPAPTEPESLVIRHTQWKGKPILLVSGSDDRGLDSEARVKAIRDGLGDEIALMADVNQVAAAVPNGLIVETFDNAKQHVAWPDLFFGFPEVEKGNVPVPDKPGWGMEINEQFIEKRCVLSNRNSVASEKPMAGRPGFVWRLVQYCKGAGHACLSSH